MPKDHIVRFTTKMGMTARVDVKVDGTLTPAEAAAKTRDQAWACQSYTYSVETPTGWVHHFSTDYGHQFDTDSPEQIKRRERSLRSRV